MATTPAASTPAPAQAAATATGSAAEAIYPRLGWQRVGVVPEYALYPDGDYCGTTFFYKRLVDSRM